MVRAQPAPQPVVYEGDPNAGTYAEAYPTEPMPEPIYEVRPAPPAYDYFWVDGYWDWTGAAWTWSGGYWAPPRQGYVFIGPRYVYEGGRPVYYRGYWQGSNGYRDYNYRVQPQPAWRGRPANPPPGGTWRGTAAAPPPSGGWRGS
ncbi:MAG TPA: hypothetical protein VHJ20_22030, partial [Polyangia bacterium]|nr:hypothetical protein [Polyangia bacterium]